MTIELATTLVHCKRDAFDVYIGRPKTPTATHWGNPFANRPGTKAALVVDDPIDAYRQWLHGTAHREIEPARRRWILDHIGTLDGMILGCWCAPHPCHGDVLIELLDEWRAKSDETEDDDLFAHIRPQPRLECRITCRACGAFATVAISHAALLCGTCSLTASQVRQRLLERQQWLVAAMERLYTDWEALETTLGEKASQRWGALKAARARGLTASELARIEEIKADGTDPLQPVLIASRETTITLQAHAMELEQVKRGLEEVDVYLEASHDHSR